MSKGLVKFGDQTWSPPQRVREEKDSLRKRKATQKTCNKMKMRKAPVLIPVTTKVFNTPSSKNIFKALKMKTFGSDNLRAGVKSKS